MYYLKNVADLERLNGAVKILIFDNYEMRENNCADIIRRTSSIFEDPQYLRRVSDSKQRWIDEDIGAITTGILDYLKLLKEAD